MDHPDPSLDKIIGEPYGTGMDGLRDLAQAVGPVVDRVHAGRYGEQHLRCADVRGRLFAADVLLSGLQGQTEAGRTVAVLGDADEPPRQSPFQTRAYGNEARVRSTVEERDTEPLARPDGHVSPPLPRRRRQRQCHQVAGRDHHRTAGMCTIGDGPQFCCTGEPAAGAGGLYQNREQVRLLDRLCQRFAGDDNLDPQRSRPGRHDPDRLRQGIGIEQDRLTTLYAAPSQCHCLGGGGRLVEQARSCCGQCGEIGDHGLKVEQGLEPSLADLRLVRRIGGIPGRRLENVSPDHRRSHSAVVAKTDHRGQRPITTGQVAQHRQGLGFREGRWQCKWLGAADRPRQ